MKLLMPCMHWLHSWVENSYSNLVAQLNLAAETVDLNSQGRPTASLVWLYQNFTGDIRIKWPRWGGGGFSGLMERDLQRGRSLLSSLRIPWH